MEALVAFYLASIISILSPGPDMVSILNYGISRGRNAAMCFGIGCASGCVFHTTIVLLGFSALIVNSPLVFHVMKIVGAMYLFYLAFHALQSEGLLKLKNANATAPVIPLWAYFMRGVICNVTNPKVVLFFMIFLPQFANLEKPVAPQIAFLGVTFTILAIGMFAVIGYFSGMLGEWVKHHSHVGLWPDRLAGLLFIGLGLNLLLWKH
jgi:threonine/homoserine/homoserine lactone efflux protein